MRRLAALLLLVLVGCSAYVAGPGVTTANDELEGLAEATCAAFEVLWLHEIVEVAQEGLGGTETDSLIFVGVVVATTCPQHIDMYIEELWEQYPHLADRVAAGIEEIAEETA